jgi:hypothetical protein
MNPMRIDYVPWADLRPHPKNPRNGDTDIITTSVQVNGVYRPIIACQDGTILAGHHLYHALGDLGEALVPVVLLPLDPASPEALRIMAVDNRSADLGQYDDGLLLDLLRGLDALNALEGSGYTPEDLQPLQDDLDWDDALGNLGAGAAETTLMRFVIPMEAKDTVEKALEAGRQATEGQEGQASGNALVWMAHKVLGR